MQDTPLTPDPSRPVTTPNSERLRSSRGRGEVGRLASPVLSGPLSRKPAVFLDRDGTLIEERHYLSRPEQVRLLPGAAEAVRLMRQDGWAVVVVTNQSGIGRGMFTLADLEAVHMELARQLAAAGTGLDGIYWCPLAPLGTSSTVVEFLDRKPGPGMLLRATRELNLDLARSWMVGDGVVDVLAGHNAGCRGSILVRSGHPIESALPYLMQGDHVVVDLVEAATLVLSPIGEKAA